MFERQDDTSPESTCDGSALLDLRAMAAQYEAATEEVSAASPPSAILTFGSGPVHMAPIPRSSHWLLWALGAAVVLLSLTSSALAARLLTTSERVTPAAPTLNVGVLPSRDGSRVAVAHEPALLAVNDAAEPPLLVDAEPVVATPAPVSIRRRTSHAPAPGTVSSERAPRGAADPEVDTSARCDELACLVDPGGPCCTGVRSESPTVDRQPPRPPRLTRRQLMAGLRSRTGRVQACFERHGASGTALVTLRIAASGELEKVGLEHENREFTRCVETAVASLTFPETQKALTVSFPYTAR